MRRISHILEPVMLEKFLNSLVITVVLITWSLVSKNVVKCSELQFNISDNLAVGGIVGNLAGTDIAIKCLARNGRLYLHTNPYFRMDYSTLNIILEEQFWKLCHHILNPYVCSKMGNVECSNPPIIAPIRINVNRNSSEYTLTMPENTLVGDEYPLDKYDRNPDPDGNYAHKYILICKNECYRDNSPTFGLRENYPDFRDVLPVIELKKALDRETIDKYTLELVASYPGNKVSPLFC